MEIIFRKELKGVCSKIVGIYTICTNLFVPFSSIPTFLSMQNKIVFSTNILLLMFANKTEPIVIKTNNLY